MLHNLNFKKDILHLYSNLFFLSLRRFFSLYSILFFFILFFIFILHLELYEFKKHISYSPGLLTYSYLPLRIGFTGFITLGWHSELQFPQFPCPPICTPKKGQFLSEHFFCRHLEGTLNFTKQLISGNI